MATGDFLLERREHVLTVTLNRPDRLNAFDASMMRALRELWTDVAADGEIRCVVVTGAGRGFCAGADVEMLNEGRSDVGRTWREELAFLPGIHLDVPVIAAVNGICAGGGLHFVADADITIAAESATFLDPHVSVGQVTALEPLTLLFAMRRDALLRMLLLGRAERLDAQQALRTGLVSEVVPDAGLMERAHALADAIAANSPAAVRESRRVIHEFETRLLDAALEGGWQTIQRHWSHPDATEGPAAFIERRPPNWRTP
jgi:enoyl-CoA hydratase/carnithine racemase